jgi:hypothetical protein
MKTISQTEKTNEINLVVIALTDGEVRKSNYTTERALRTLEKSKIYLFLCKALLRNEYKIYQRLNS